MLAKPSQSPEYLLACIGFGTAELEAASRLISLLGTNLKQRWRLANPGEQADLSLVNLEADADVGTLRHGIVAYCAHKPSQHRLAALHLPLRSYELLNLLNAEAPAGRGRPGRSRAEPDVRRYRLRSWPLQANAWSRDRWRVMAAIRHHARSVNGLAMQTGIAVESVQRCLDDLQRLEALECCDASVRTQAPVAAPPSGWREVAARVGHLLGFSR